MTPRENGDEVRGETVSNLKIIKCEKCVKLFLFPFIIEYILHTVQYKYKIV